MLDALLSLFRLFTGQQRRQAAGLVVVMMGGMVLETLGIGIIVPALSLITGAGPAGRASWLQHLAGSLHLDADGRSIAYAMLVLAAVYTVKTAYLAWSTWLQMRFVYAVQANFSLRLFSSYLYKPYTFHLQRNSAELIRNVVNITNELTLTGLVSLLILTTESLVLAGIGALLLYVEPVGTLVAAGFLALLGAILNGTTRASIRRAARDRHEHEAMRIRFLQQAIGASKELKVLGREAGAISQYAPHNDASARIGRYHATLQALPKLWLELLAVYGLASLVLVLAYQGRPMAALVPTLGMFAAAAFRLIPSLNRILGSIHYIRLSTPTIETLSDELHDAAKAAPDSPVGAPIAFDKQLEIRGLTVRYPGAEQPALEDISLTVAAGTTVGIVGESGSGKSTLVDALLGVLPAQAGSILVDGVDVTRDPRAWQAQIGYVPQSIFLVDDSLRRNIALGLPDDRIDEARILAAVRLAQLENFVAQLPDGLDTMVGERGVRLSGGQRQRIGIARALFHDPKVLVLDEATSSLDSDTEQGVMASVNALHGSKTIIMVTHRTDTLRFCDRVVRIDAGRISADATPPQALPPTGSDKAS